MDMDTINNKSALQFSIMPSDKMSETIPETQIYDAPYETVNINQDKYKTPYDAYKLCGNVTSCSVTESICANVSLLKEKTLLKSHFETTTIATNILKPQDNVTSVRLMNDLSVLPAIVEPTFTSINDELKAANNQNVINTEEEKELKYSENYSELLTTDKFNETFTNNLKACFNTSTARLNTSSFLANNSILNKLDLSTLRLDTTKNLFGKTQQLTTSLHTSKLISIDETNLEDEDQTDALSETIVNSIQEPFNIEFKNKLLAKQTDFFSNRSNYISLAIDTPSVQVNGCVTLSSQYLNYN